MANACCVCLLLIIWASLVAQMVKNPPAIQETWVRSPGQEDPLENGIATHSSILAWRIPWTEEPGGLQIMRSQRVRHVLLQCMKVKSESEVAQSCPTLRPHGCSLPGSYVHGILQARTLEWGAIRFSRGSS